MLQVYQCSHFLQNYIPVHPYHELYPVPYIDDHSGVILVDIKSKTATNNWPETLIYYWLRSVSTKFANHKTTTFLAEITPEFSSYL